MMKNLVTVVAISGQAACGNRRTVSCSSAEVEVVAGLAAQQVGVSKDDAGPVLGQVVDDLVDLYTFFFDAHLTTKQNSQHLKS